MRTHLANLRRNGTTGSGRTVAGPSPAAHYAAGAGHGGWAARRLAVIQRASGVCARCGARGADTAFRSWDSGQLLAVHTRCVVGLGPAITPAGDDAA